MVAMTEPESGKMINENKVNLMDILARKIKNIIEKSREYYEQNKDRINENRRIKYNLG
jgi:hypothetical protein